MKMLSFVAHPMARHFVEIYQFGAISIFLAIPVSTKREGEAYAKTTGRPEIIFHRRLARRIAELVGFEGNAIGQGGHR